MVVRVLLVAAALAMLCHVAASVAPKNVTIVGMFPLTGGLALGGVEREAAYRMGLEIINDDPSILPDTQLNYYVLDTKTDASSALFEVIKTLNDESVTPVGFVGAASSSVSKAVQQVVSIFGYPQISYSSTSTTLSNKEIYPTFMRVVPSDALQSSALARLIRWYGYDEVSIVATDDEYGTAGVIAFTSSAAAIKLSVATSQTFSVGLTDYADLFSHIEAGGARVIVLNCVTEDAVALLSAAYEHGMLSGNYVWLGTDGWLQDSLLSLFPEENQELMAAALVGVIGTRPHTGSGPGFQAFLDAWESRNSTHYAGAGDRDANIYAPFAYDALWTYAHALDRMVKDGADIYDGPELVDYLANVTFEGATGHVQLDKNYDRVSDYDIVNYLGATQGFYKAGVWSNIDQVFVLEDESRPLRWVGNITTPPFLPSPPRSSSSTISTTVSVVIAVLCAVLCVFLGLLFYFFVLYRRRSSAVHQLERINDELVVEHKALQNQLAEIDRVRQLRANSKINVPVNRVLGLLFRLREEHTMGSDSTEGSMLPEIQFAIDTISSDVLFQPSQTDMQNLTNDNQINEWVAQTLVHDKRVNNAGRLAAVAENSPRISDPATTGISALEALGGGQQTDSLQTLLHVPEEAQHQLQRLDTLDFDIFSFAAVVKSPLCKLVMHVMEAHDLFALLPIDPQVMYEYLRALDAGYGRSNPFHNVLHAADCVQSLHFLLVTSGVGKHLEPLEVFSLIFATTIHDYEHPGRDATFLMRTRHALAVRYNDDSVLENHHLASAFRLAYDSFQLFSEFGEHQHEYMRMLVISLVMSTDMQRHLEILGRFTSLIEATHPSKRMAWQDAMATDEGFRTLALQVVVKVVDVMSHTTRPLPLARNWAYRSMAEFALQGADERARGLEVSPFMDGDPRGVPTAQEGYVAFVALPLIEAFNSVFPIADCLTNMNDTLNHWTNVDIDRVASEMQMAKELIANERTLKTFNPLHQSLREAATPGLTATSNSSVATPVTGGWTSSARHNHNSASIPKVSSEGVPMNLPKHAATIQLRESAARIDSEASASQSLANSNSNVVTPVVTTTPTLPPVAPPSGSTPPTTSAPVTPSQGQATASPTHQ